MFKLQGSANQALVAATVGFFVGAMSISLFGPTAKALTDAMGLSPVEVGLLVAMPSLSGSLLRIPFGASVDVNGGRKSMLFLLTLSVIGLVALCALFTAAYPGGMRGLYPLVLALGCLAGCGIATFSVGASQVAYWFPKRRQGYALGVFAGLATTSAGIMAVALPLLLGALGLVGAYYAVTLFLAAGALFYAAFSCNAPFFQLLGAGRPAGEARRLAAAEYGQELFPVGNIRESLLISARIPQTWFLVGTYFTTFGGFMALTAWFPTYWQNAVGLGPVHAGVLTMIFSVTAALTRVPGGAVADRFGGVPTCFAALFLTAAATAAMNLPLGWEAQFALTIVIAVAFGVNNAACMKLIPVYVPQSVGGASGWVGGLGAFGGFVFPPVLGAIAAGFPQGGYGYGFLVFAALALANAFVNYFGMVRRA